jgi:hypothetical protein
VQTRFFKENNSNLVDHVNKVPTVLIYHESAQLAIEAAEAISQKTSPSFPIS